MQEQRCSFIAISSDELESSKDDDDELPPGPCNTQSTSTNLLNSSTSQSVISEDPLNSSDISKLQALFGEKLSLYQIEVVYKASGSDFQSTMECLLKGPTSQSIKKCFRKVLP